MYKQNNIKHIKKSGIISVFVWRFCINYIPLNAVTKIIAMPIPRCNEAVTINFGGSKWRWLMDAISGYNQIKVARSSHKKLAFSGPNCTKYTYNVKINNRPSIYRISVETPREEVGVVKCGQIRT